MFWKDSIFLRRNKTNPTTKKSWFLLERKHPPEPKISQETNLVFSACLELSRSRCLAVVNQPWTRFSWWCWQSLTPDNGFFSYANTPAHLWLQQSLKLSKARLSPAACSSAAGNSPVAAVGANDFSVCPQKRFLPGRLSHAQWLQCPLCPHLQKTRIAIKSLLLLGAWRSTKGKLHKCVRFHHFQNYCSVLFIPKKMNSNRREFIMARAISIMIINPPSWKLWKNNEKVVPVILFKFAV